MHFGGRYSKSEYNSCLQDNFLNISNWPVVIICPKGSVKGSWSSKLLCTPALVPGQAALMPLQCNRATEAAAMHQ